MFRRVIWIVLDSVGIGEMPDAAVYGDRGSDTLGHIAQHRKLDLPNLRRPGLANIRPLENLPPVGRPAGGYGEVLLAYAAAHGARVPTRGTELGLPAGRQCIGARGVGEHDRNDQCTAGDAR